jgi:dihydroxy-acid dehydratase
MDDPRFTGTAICLDDSKAVHEAAAEGRIRPGHIVVMRGGGPVASGMPEVHVASAALAVPELKGKVALITDTRVSGVSSGAVGVHCSPEAAVGGPIAAVRDGDPISFDLLAGTIHVDADLTAPDRQSPIVPVRHQRGYLADFATTVTQAHQGCVSQWVTTVK